MQFRWGPLLWDDECNGWIIGVWGVYVRFIMEDGSLWTRLMFGVSWDGSGALSVPGLPCAILVFVGKTIDLLNN